MVAFPFLLGRIVFLAEEHRASLSRSLRGRSTRGVRENMGSARAEREGKVYLRALSGGFNERGEGVYVTNQENLKQKSEKSIGSNDRPALGDA